MGLLIGVSGSAGAGKETVANYLVDGAGFVKVSFADPLKRICKDVFDFSDEALWGASEFRSQPDKRYPRPVGFTYPVNVRSACWVPLTKGEHALIDEEDLERVVRAGPWCVVYKEKGKRTKYAKATISGKEIKLHQFIMGASKIDHINCDGLDNRKINLRQANDSLNHANMLPRQGGSSPFKGVCYDSARKKWSAKICIDTKTINLGRFDSELDAVAPV